MGFAAEEMEFWHSRVWLRAERTGRADCKNAIVLKRKVKRVRTSDRVVTHESSFSFGSFIN